VPRSRIGGSLPPLPLYTYMVWLLGIAVTSLQKYEAITQNGQDQACMG